MAGTLKKHSLDGSMRLLLWVLLIHCHWMHLATGAPSAGYDDDDEQHNAETRLRKDLGLPLSFDGRDEALHNYSHILPPHNKTSPVTVRIGLSIILIRQLDTLTQILTLEGWLKLEWTDTRFSWKKEDYGGLEEIRVPEHQIWLPDIKIYNTAKMSEIDVKSDVLCLLYASALTVWIPPVTLYTVCEVDLKNYPYDSHWCSIKIGSWTHSGYQIDLALLETGADVTDLWNSAGEWQVIETSAKRSIAKYPCCESPYVDVTFKVLLRRRSPLFGLTVLCPIVAAVILALVAFWLPPSAYERVTVNAVSLLTLVLVLKHLADIIPPVGSRSPIIVAFCGEFIVLVGISMSASIFIVSFLRGHQHQPVPHWVHVALRSKAASVFCLSTSGSFAMHGADTAKLEVLQDNEDPENQRSASVEMRQTDRNQWTRFFQLVDRITFAVFALVTLVVIVVSIV